MNAVEALDYLVNMARGHDYADDGKILEAECELMSALGDAYEAGGP